MSTLVALLTRFLDALLGNQGHHEVEVTRPQPVLDEAKAAAKRSTIVATLVTALGVLGVSSTDAGLIGVVLTVVLGAVFAVAQAVFTIRAAYAARPLVTPLSSPRNARLQTLVPAP